MKNVGRLLLVIVSVFFFGCASKPWTNPDEDNCQTVIYGELEMAQCVKESCTFNDAQGRGFNWCYKSIDSNNLLACEWDQVFQAYRCLQVLED